MRKKVFKRLLLGLVVVLMLLPFTAAFNDWLTGLTLGTGVGRWIEQTIMAHLVRVTVGILRVLGMRVNPGESMFAVKVGAETLSIRFALNCLGWQSMVLFVFSSTAAFSGGFTWGSKVEALVIGLMGTYLLNLFRIVASVLAVVYVNQVFMFVLHDYLAALLTLAWLVSFWWFSFKYVLRVKYQR